jgi:large subunit ribosomal protein L25
MKVVSVSGSPRENVGKKDAKKLRREGLIPCVLYGGEKQIHFAIPLPSFKEIIYTPNSYLIELEIDGKKYMSVLQDSHFHPVSDDLLHADFLQVFEEVPVKISIPVRLVGNSPGVRRGGKLHLKLRKLRVKALPAELPDVIEIDISKLNVAESIKVGELKFKGIEMLDPGSSVIVTVKAARVMAGADDEESADEAGEAPAQAETAAE